MPRPFIIIFFVLLSTALAVFSLLNSDFLSSKHTGAIGFGISPPKIGAANLKPGDKFSQTIVALRSRAADEQMVNVSIMAPKIQSWITVEPAWNSRFEIGDLQLPVKFTIEVPPGAETGRYTGQIYFAFRRLADGGGVSIQTGARADIELEVQGLDPANEEAEIPAVEEGIAGPESFIILNPAMYNRLRGRIVLKIEDKGEAWYIHPDQKTAYFLGRPSDAQKLMVGLGEGISDSDLNEIPAAEEKLSADADKNFGFPEALDINESENQEAVEPEAEFNIAAAGSGDLALEKSGKILLQVESHGEAWYVNPVDKKRYFLGRPEDAFRLMRELGLGISNDDFDLLLLDTLSRP